MLVAFTACVTDGSLDGDRAPRACADLGDPSELAACTRWGVDVCAPRPDEACEEFEAAIPGGGTFVCRLADRWTGVDPVCQTGTLDRICIPAVFFAGVYPLGPTYHRDVDAGLEVVSYDEIERPLQYEACASSHPVPPECDCLPR